MRLLITLWAGIARGSEDYPLVSLVGDGQTPSLMSMIERPERSVPKARGGAGVSDRGGANLHFL